MRRGRFFLDSQTCEKGLYKNLKRVNIFTVFKIAFIIGKECYTIWITLINTYYGVSNPVMVKDHLGFIIMAYVCPKSVNMLPHEQSHMSNEV